MDFEEASSALLQVCKHLHRIVRKDHRHTHSSGDFFSLNIWLSAKSDREVHFRLMLTNISWNHWVVHLYHLDGTKSELLNAWLMQEYDTGEDRCPLCLSTACSPSACLDSSLLTRCSWGQLAAMVQDQIKQHIAQLVTANA